jgi:8-oxo-dGTP pyrophosphatase MutT (NUDIX family)
MGFSLPPETHHKIENLLKKTHKTRSEFMRQIIDTYLEVSQKTIQEAPRAEITISPSDINKILKFYFQIIGANKKEVLVIGLGIISKEGKVLIGQRKEKDPQVKELSWVFPGGRLKSLDLEAELKREVKEETGLNVYVNQLIHARLIPDSPEKKVKIVALYYHCTPVSGKEKPAGDLKKLAWVPAMKVFHYFTTSTADEVVSFLGLL